MKMRIKVTRRVWRWFGAGTLAVLALFIVVRTWLVPTFIVRVIRSHYGGRVTIRDWWVNTHSTGIRGLVLHEGVSADSPVWATADSVSTDLTVGGLLRGQFSPGKLNLRSPHLTFRLDSEGRPLSRLPLKPSRGGGGALPNIVVRDARVTLVQQGRPHAMEVSGINASLEARPDTVVLNALANDPTWGTWDAHGRLDAESWAGTIDVDGRNIDADLDKLRRLPYIPLDVWSHVAPRGPLEVKAALRVAPGAERPIRVETEVSLNETTVSLPTLGFATTRTHGRLLVHDAVVRLDRITGRALGGRADVGGTLDFSKVPSRFDLTLHLDKVSVAETPKFWRLGEFGLTGRLTGEADLRVVLAQNDIDLSGTTGEAVIEGGAIQGIPVKQVRLKMHGERDNLKYETGPSSGAQIERLVPLLIGVQPPAGQTGSRAVQTSRAEQAEAQKPSSGFAIKLPRSVTTEFELDDVDLRRILARVETVGIRVPLPIDGRVTLKCEATIPLGGLKDLRKYRFHGRMVLAGASISGVDLGRLDANLELAQGVLKLSEFSGQLVDMPDGGVGHRPAPTGPLPANGPLPEGAFRGTLSAELSPPGRLTLGLEGHRLPLGELVAPALPRPTPVSGTVNVALSADASVAEIDDVQQWSASGTIESERVSYRNATLDSFASSISVADGRLTLPNVTARLEGQALKAHGALGLSRPYAFDVGLNVAGWDLSDVLAFVPSSPRPAPIDGALTAEAEATGTLAPWGIQSSGGHGYIAEFHVGEIPLGKVPFHWSTDQEALHVSGVEATPFGGRISLDARVPTRAGRAIVGNIKLAHISMSRLVAALPAGHPALSGSADGKVDVLVRPGAPGDAPLVEANVQLRSADLKVQDLAAKSVQAVITLRKETLAYDLYAETLGGKMDFKGEMHLNATTSNVDASGRARAVDLQIGDLWKTLGVSSALSKLQGVVALDANLLADAALKHVRAHGFAEVRDLRWTNAFPLGRLKGIFTRTVDGWRLDPVDGEILGSPARGSVWGDTLPGQARRIGFGLDLEHVPLRRTLVPFPQLAKALSGTGTLRLAGRLNESLQVDAEAVADRGHIFGFPVSELRIPATLTYHPEAGFGSLQVRRMTARLAGGRLRGDARYHFGSEPSFTSEFHVDEVNLETFARLFTDSRRPAIGRITGRVTLAGHDPSDVRRYRGQIMLDLDDASIGELPIFRQIDRFLGSSSGGMFEDGDLLATIGNRQINVEELTLVGRLAQLHASGTVGFDGELNLVVLVNTSQIISETGQALIRLIPGLGDAVGRREQAVSRVGSFLSTRLLKLRVTGTLRNPQVNADPAIIVTEAAVGFFGGILKLPLNLFQ